MSNKIRMDKAEGKIARVWYEGEHPDQGHISVVLLFIRADGSVHYCFLRLRSNPASLKIGARIRFNNEGIARYQDDKKTGLVTMVQGAFTEYENPGTIFAGG